MYIVHTIGFWVFAQAHRLVPLWEIALWNNPIKTSVYEIVKSSINNNNNCSTFRHVWNHVVAESIKIIFSEWSLWLLRNYLTLAPPALFPKIVTLFGFPPNWNCIKYMKWNIKVLTKVLNCILYPLKCSNLKTIMYW